MEGWRALDLTEAVGVAIAVSEDERTTYRGDSLVDGVLGIWAQALLGGRECTELDLGRARSQFVGDVTYSEMSIYPGSRLSSVVYHAFAFAGMTEDDIRHSAGSWELIR
ncbi:MAG: hypothetical protein AAFX40_13785 [Cyanobacteria bacterium J06639_1]